MKALKIVTITAGFVTICWLLLIDTTTPIPPTAHVFVDVLRRSYFAPPLISEDPRTFVAKTSLRDLESSGVEPATEADAALTKGWGHEPSPFVWLDLRKFTYSWDPPPGAIIVNASTLQEAETLGAHPDERHTSMSGFIYRRSNLHYYLETFGILGPRWTTSGDWRW